MRFYPGQDCWFQTKSVDGKPTLKLGRIIDVDKNGGRYLVHYDGILVWRLPSELQPTYGVPEEI